MRMAFWLKSSVSKPVFAQKYIEIAQEGMLRFAPRLLNLGGLVSVEQTWIVCAKRRAKLSDDSKSSDNYQASNIYLNQYS